MSKSESTQNPAEVVPWDEPDAVAMIEPTQELVAKTKQALLDGSVPPEIGDPNVTARMIRQRILEGSFDESLDPAASLTPWSQFIDEPVVVHSFHLNPSAFKNESGIGMYAVVELGLPETGEFVTVSAGGGNVLAQLIKAWEESRYPFRAKLTSSQTGSGNSVHRLERA